MKYARRRRLENRPIRNGRQRRRCGSRLGCLGGRLLNEGRYRTFEKKLVTLYFCTHIVSGIAYVIVRRNRTQTLRRKCRPEEKKKITKTIIIIIIYLCRLSTIFLWPYV